MGSPDILHPFHMRSLATALTLALIEYQPDKNLPFASFHLAHKYEVFQESLDKILNKKLIEEKIDISLPERPFKEGGIHPISKTLD